MKTMHIILTAGAIILLTTLSIFISIRIDDVEEKVEQLKPKKTETIEDYQNLIEDSKKKIDEITEEKWLKVSDIKNEMTLISNFYRIYESEWRELLTKAKDAPVDIRWTKTETYEPIVDVSIGVSAEQIVKAFKSIDPNSLIRKQEKEPSSIYLHYEDKP